MKLQQKQTTLLPLAKLQPNEGQILGLPRNPRKWSEDAIAKLEKSLRDDPEFLQFNPLIVYPYIAETGGAQYVIIGGNMRYSVIKEKELFDRVPCMVLPEDTPSEKLRAYTIKDNTGFGDWDWELIGADWSDDPLEDWGSDFVFGNTTPSNGLPEELTGIDLSPDELPKLEGDDETAMERILITYRPDEADALAALLGLEKLEKVVYNYEIDLK